MNRSSRINRHKLPTCTATGLARYRDRHQARQAIAANRGNRPGWKLTAFTCPDCRGVHIERLRRPGLEAINIESLECERAAPRYVLVDIENLAAGHLTRTGVRKLWNELVRSRPGLTSADHIVIGASRRVARQLAPVLGGKNVEWVVGDDGPDGADRALLAAIDLRRVAKLYSALVIMSGDHCFADLASQATRLGLRVQVVTTERPDRPRPALSRRLAAASSATFVLPGSPSSLDAVGRSHEAA